MDNLFSATQQVVKCSRRLMVSNDYLLHNQDNTDKHRIAQGGMNSPVLASESHSNRLNERWD